MKEKELTASLTEIMMSSGKYHYLANICYHVSDGLVHLGCRRILSESSQITRKNSKMNE
jgi:hypothetical protein